MKICIHDEIIKRIKYHVRTRLRKELWHLFIDCKFHIRKGLQEQTARGTVVINTYRGRKTDEEGGQLFRPFLEPYKWGTQF